jgi:succinate dehydrogenase / fumarate reductase cytochrome b subunit
MVTSLKDAPGRPRPVYRNIHVTQIASYRLPAAAWVSILHRISGAVLFLLMPFAIWLFDRSVSSGVSWEQFAAVFTAGAAGVPGWFWRLLAFALIWAYFLHFFAGLRHLWLDATHQLGLAFGRMTALAAIIAGTLVAFAIGAKLFIG